MKVKILLVFVMIYLAGAFSWWTYSLLKLSKSDFELANQNMELTTKVIESSIFKDLNSFKVETGKLVFYENSFVNVDTSKLNNYVLSKYNSQYLIEYSDYLTGLKFKVIPSRSFKNTVDKEYKIRRRAYISESIFFILLLIVGFVWIFRSLDKIIDLNKLQKNFMMAVTHELKTPVAALKLMMQTLSKHNLDEVKRNEIINKSEQSTDRLASLIDELLLAIKIEHKELPTSFNWVDVNKLVTELVELYSMNSLESEIKVSANKELKIWGDYLSVKTCFSNIIENAIKYGGEQLQLHISIDADNNEISFADNGKGIPSYERKKVFRQFYRVGDESTRSTKGTGLGLYLVKNLLKIHNAKISILSNNPKGTIFVIKF